MSEDVSYTKTCSRCSVYLPITDFRPRYDRPGKTQSWCKRCVAKYQRDRVQAAKDKTPAPTISSKACTRCGEVKGADEFYLSKTNANGLSSACKKCENERIKRWEASNRDHVRLRRRDTRAKNVDEYRLKEISRKLLRKYGLTVDDYQRLLDEQGGGCAVCHVDLCKVNDRLSVDHCHQTGQVRGLLCHACNVGLGLFTDDPERLETAAAYLRRSLSTT